MTVFTHARTIEVAWGDCDPAGIVFHPRYFEWFDASAAALLAAGTGMRKAQLQAHYGIVGIPVVEASATFNHPCRYGDVVVITSQVVEWKRSSFRLEHALHASDLLAVTGRSTRVWAGRDPDDPTRIRAVALPEEMIRTFGETPNREGLKRRA